MSHPSKRELKRSQYRLLGLVGQGQFGRVYCASHRQKGHIVALKELDKLRFPTHKFLREMRFLVSLEHPNIVTLYALEHTPTGRYIVMDYCEGGTLRNLIQEDVRLHPAQALKLVADVLAGLEHAHSRGIVHCDIKPENILLTLTPAGWTARISDFGIARLNQEIATQDSQTGSPAYMAPERFYGAYSYASDLYAVGIVLFELLTGDRPFSGIPSDLMLAHLNQAVKIPDGMPAVLQLLIRRSLQKLPARRFRSAATMLAAVHTAAVDLADLSGDGPPQKTPPALLQLVTPLIPSAFRAVSVLPLASPVRQLMMTVTQGAAGLPMSPPTEQLYLVFDQQIQRWHYPQPVLLAGNPSASQPDGLASHCVAGLEQAQVWLPAPIQSISLTATGCAAIAHRGLYHLEAHQFGPLCSDADGQGDSSGAALPMAIAQFSQDVVMTTDPQGQWMAAATRAQMGPLQVGRVSGSTPRLRVTSGIVSHPQQLIALDARYLAAFGQGPHAAPGQSRLQVLSRRGTSVASQMLPVVLDQIIPTPRPYRLLATEVGHATSVLLLDLKPFRMRRIGVEIVPKLLVATPWGYILAAASGQIVILNQQGEIVGCIAGPAAPTAIAPVAGAGLAIATWQQGAGHLHIVDLRQLDLDLMF